MQMIGNTEEVTKTLQEGKDIPLDEYYRHCKINTVKTFYYFIEILLHYKKGKYLVSSCFREQINYKLGGIFKINPRFNPEGWFGRSWTEGHLDTTSHFRKIYSDILERSETEPYKYRIKEEYYDIVKTAISEIDSNLMNIGHDNLEESNHNQFSNLSDLIINPDFPFNLMNLLIKINTIKGFVKKVSSDGKYFILYDGEKERKFDVDFLKSKSI
jgi:hypothetical protein